MGNDRCLPSAFSRGEAERLLSMTPALGECAEVAQGLRQPRPGRLRQFMLGVPDSRSATSTFHRPNSAAQTKLPTAAVGHPQEHGCVRLQSAIAKLGREIASLPAHSNGAVKVSH